MASRNALRTLVQADQATLLRQWYQSGKCLRCFHASKPRAVREDKPVLQNTRDKANNDQDTPYNKPSRGPSRHQRAAQISEEVRMLNRDTVNIGPSKPSNDNPNDYVIGPQGVDPSTSADVMGANDSPEREGPLAQGVARLPHGRREEETLGNDVSQLRGVRMPGGGLENPKKGEAGVLQGDKAGSGLGDDMSKDNELPVQADVRTPQSAMLMEGMQRPKPSGNNFQPLPMSNADLVDAGNYSSTIAASNFVGVLNDHIRHAVEPGIHPARRDVGSLAGKQLAKQLIRFNSEEEKETVLDHAVNIHTRGLGDMYLSDEAKLAKKREKQEESSNQEDAAQEGKDGQEVAAWEPLPESLRNSLIRKTVNGHYDEAGLLRGAEVHKQKVLNDVATMMLRNGTYLHSDSARFLAKVQSLLPAAAAQQARGQAKAPKMKQAA